MADEEPEAVEFAREIAAEAPDIDPAWDWIWAAWLRLGEGDRPYLTQGIGAPMGGTIIRSAPAPIPWSALRRWCAAHRISPDDEALMDQCFRVLDADFIAWWAEENRVKTDAH